MTETLTKEELETIYIQLIEHLGEIWTPEEAMNRATDIIDFYLDIDKKQPEEPQKPEPEAKQ